MDPVAVVSRAGGAARAVDLRRAGCSRRRLASAVAAGDLLRIGGGALALPGADQAVVSAVHHRASLACVSALDHRGFELLEVPGRVHLTGNRGRPDRRVTWHRGVPAGLTVRVAMAAAQLLCCRPAVEGLVAVDGLLRAGHATVAEIAAELPPNSGGHARWVLTHASPLAGSVMESLLRCTLLLAGVRGVILQAPIDGVGRVDFLIDGWLVVETDGWGTHGDRGSFERDRERDVAAAVQGHQTLRFTWSAVRDRPALVVACVQEVLARGRGTPATGTDATGRYAWDG